VGKRINCPKCKTPFVPEEEVEDIPVAELVEVAAAPVAAKPAPPKPAPQKSSPPRPLAPPPIQKTKPREEEDDRPSARNKRVEDAEVDRPRSKSRRDEDDDEDRPAARGKRVEAEDDDRPRSRSRRDEDDDEDRPPARNKRVEEDEDDRPRRSRRRDEDEDEDDRPRVRRDYDDDPPSRSRRSDDDDRRPRRRKKKRGLLLLLLIGGPAAAVVIIGIVLYFNLLGGGGPPKDMLAWAPSDSTTITYIDYAALRRHRTDGGPEGGMPIHGVHPRDIESTMQADGGEGTVMVIKTTYPMDREKVLSSALNGINTFRQSRTANGKTYYELFTGEYVYFASDRMLVHSRSQSAITSRLGRDEETVNISPEMKSLFSRTQGDAWSIKTAGRGTYTHNGSRVESSVGWVRVSGDTITTGGEITFESESAAQVAYDQAMAAQIPNGTKSVSKSGRRVTVKFTRTERLDSSGFDEFGRMLR
jgi:hypothetical protein